MRCRECGKLTCINRSACRRKADEARRREVERNYTSSSDLTSPSYGLGSFYGSYSSSYGASDNSYESSSNSCGSSSSSYGSPSSSYGSSSDSCESGSWD